MSSALSGYESHDGEDDRLILLSQLPQPFLLQPPASGRLVLPVPAAALGAQRLDADNRRRWRRLVDYEARQRHRQRGAADPRQGDFEGIEAHQSVSMVVSLPATVKLCVTVPSVRP